MIVTYGSMWDEDYNQACKSFAKISTVDSLLFVGYHFLWEQVNHEFKSSTNYKFPIGFFYAEIGQSTKPKYQCKCKFSSIHEMWYPRK